MDGREFLVIEHVRVRVLPDGRMGTDDTSKYLDRTKETLKNWRFRGYGPRWVTVGGKVYYFKDDVDAFIRGEITSDPPVDHGDAARSSEVCADTGLSGDERITGEGQ
jgi:hypothetical protein